jgi:hypothetical protein
MKRIKCEIHYPWAGVEPDVEYLEINEEDYIGLTDKEIEEMALETLQEMVWNRVGATWEVEDGEE